MTRDDLIARFGLENLDPEKWPPAADALLTLIADCRALREIAGPNDAYRALQQLTVFARPARRPRGATDPGYNAALFLAYETAPSRKKLEAVRAIMRQHNRVVTDDTLATAMRQVRRVQRRGMNGEEFMAAPVQALLDLTNGKPDE